MKIHTTQHFAGHWTANFDNYDYAPDAAPQDVLLGYGDSKQEAIEDLMERADEYQVDAKRPLTTIFGLLALLAVGMFMAAPWILEGK